MQNLLKEEGIKHLVQMEIYLHFGFLSTLFNLVLSSVRFHGNPQQGSSLGKQYKQGYVEILNRGSWRRLAATFFDDNDATVICKMMGYKLGGQHVRQNQISNRNAGKYATLGSLACTGHEESIESCPHASHSNNPWFHYFGISPVVVRCFTRASHTCATYRCPPQSSCYMRYSYPTCQCQRSGFKYWKLRNVCEDINECRERIPCSRNAYCYNTPGSYVCRCKSGFQGNGRVCSSKCNSHRCPSNSLCSLWNGNPRCNCRSGYVAKGNSCVSNNQRSSTGSSANKSGKKVNAEKIHLIVGAILGGAVVILLMALIFYKVRQRSLHTAPADRTNATPNNHSITGTTNVFVITNPSTSNNSNDRMFDQLPNYFTLYPDGITNSGTSQLGEAPSYEDVIGGGNHYDSLATVNPGNPGGQCEASANSNPYDNVAYESQGPFEPPPPYEE